MLDLCATPSSRPLSQDWEMIMDKQANINDRQWELWWGVRRSIRYHDRRIVWFDSIHRVGRFITLVAGGSAAATILKQHEGWSLLLTLTCAFFSALDLAFDVSANARKHCALKMRFVDLEREVNLKGYENLTDEQVRLFCTRRSEIERDEPPILRCLDTLCHNELCRADGIPDRIAILWWQRFLAHVWYGDPPEHHAHG
jgi:hypothetical protein